jgi:hypothetical protein
MSVLPEHDHNLISNRDINRDAITCDQLASVAERYQHQRIYRTPIMKKQRSYEYSSSYNVNVATMSTAATGKEEDVMKAVAPMRTGTTGKDQAGMKTLEFPPGEEIDRLVAQAMLELSAEEREKALEETHGVVEVDKEDPDFIASCLDDLDNCLAIRKEDTAYAVAEQMSFEYVSNNRFRIMFLRAMRYIPQDACERIIQFFEYKKELFGAEKLVKDITLDDLSDDDLGPLEGGYIQVAPGEDMNRRPILIFCEKVKQQQNKQPENSVSIFPGQISRSILSNNFSILTIFVFFSFLSDGNTDSNTILYSHVSPGVRKGSKNGYCGSHLQCRLQGNDKIVWSKITEFTTPTLL